jgi:hypothetical protein
MDQESHASDDQQEQGRKLIDLECKRNIQAGGIDKTEQPDLLGSESVNPNFHEDQNTQDE